ncbi:uncharacterized protein [Antedon mediterranea]|uniref:uncharacterized protein n=1 Tax=Antedon mediterranea TaxID=105859 RepID=UPI003AF9D71E
MLQWRRIILILSICHVSNVYGDTPVWTNCPADININTDDGMSTGTANWTEPTVTDETPTDQLVIVILYDSMPSSVMISSFDIGTTNVRYHATDDENPPLTGVCEFTITVTDNEAPVIMNCPMTEIMELTAEGENDMVVTWTATSATDNSGTIPSETATHEPGDMFEIGTTEVVITYTDSASNVAECAFNVTVQDEESPQTSNCPESMTEIISDAESTATSIWSEPIFTDNDDVVNVDSTHSSGQTFNIGSTEVLYTATDPSGNNGTCSFNITVLQDIEPPEFTFCPNDTVVSTLPGANYSIVNWTLPEVTDDVQLISLAQAVTDYSTTGERFYIGTTQLRFIAVDVVARTSQCIFNIIVNDDEDPTITCSTNFTIYVESGEQYAIVEYNVSATDNDRFPNITTSDPASGSQLGIGVTSFTITATDQSDNSAQCSFYVTVLDNEAPNITFCPGNITINTEPGESFGIATWQQPTAIDNSGEAVAVTTETHSNGSSFSLMGSPHTVSLTLADSSSNTAICSFAVTVIDEEAPETNCTNDYTVNTTLGLAISQSVPYPFIIFEDNSGLNVDTTLSMYPPYDLPIGQTVIEVNGTDAYGNVATCQYTITVEDNENPEIICPENQTVVADMGSMGTQVSWSTPNATDNSGQVSVTLVDLMASGSTFLIGDPVTLTYTAQDDSGNEASCTFVIQVLDMESPMIANCPIDIVNNTDPSINSTTITWDEPTFSDNSGRTSNSSSHSSGDTFYIGVTTVYYMIEDESGNMATCNFTITILDTESPTFTCQQDTASETLPGVNYASTIWQLPTYEDNSFDEVTVTSSHPNQPVDLEIGDHVIMYNFTDTSGNQASCSFTITINDNEAPQVTVCPGNITDFTLPDLAYNTSSWTPPNATDNSGYVETSSTHEPGDEFYIGTTEVMYNFTDGSQNVATCVFTVTITDDQPPSLNCSSNFNITTELDQPYGVVVYNISADDNDGLMPLINTSDPVSGSQLQIGLHEFSIEAIDSSGNTAQCSFYVEVIDDQPPNIVCPPNFNILTDVGQSYAVFDYNLTSNDNSGVMPAIYTMSPMSGSQLQIGMHTFSFEAVDPSSNSVTCSFFGSVEDHEPPTTNCTEDIHVAASENMTTAINVAYPDIIFKDNSGMNITVSENIASPSDFRIGITQVVVNGTDTSGNSVRCIFYVNVTDSENPMISCPANQTLPADEGSTGTQVTWDDATATDNSGVVTVVQGDGEPSSGGTFTLGSPRTLSYIATDESGNYATCTFVIYIIDMESPEIMNCPTGRVNSTDLSINSTTISWDEPTYSDNTNDVLTSDSTHSSGDEFFIGVTTVVYTVEDESGNMATCNFTVTILDLEPPTFNCSDDIILNTSPGENYASATWQPPTYEDNSFDDVTVTSSHGDPPVNLEIGDHDIMYNFTDQSDNQASCSFTITVNDNQAPQVIFCPEDVNVTSIDFMAYNTIYWNPPNVTDNSGNFTTTNTHDSGDTFFIGITEVVYTFTDGAENVATCAFNVTIIDDEEPVVFCPSNATYSTEPGLDYANVSYMYSASDNDVSPPTVTTLDAMTGALEEETQTTSTVTVIENVNIGTHGYDLIATDTSGNIDECSFYIIVEDDEAPMITNCPITSTIYTVTGESFGLLSFSPATASDNSGSVSVSSVGIPLDLMYYLASSPYTIVYTFSDNSSNTANCSFQVIVTDIEPPTSNCSSDLSFTTSPNMAVAVNVTLPTIVFDDNSDEAVNVLQNINSPYDFPIGSTLIVVNGTDPYSNTFTCEYSINVTDNEAPVILNCPGNITEPTSFGAFCGYANWTELEFSDNSEDNLTVNVNGVEPDNRYSIGLTLVEYIVEDNSGNSASCSFFVNIIDNEPPFALCYDVKNFTVDGKPFGVINTYNITGFDNSLDNIEFRYDIETDANFSIGETEVFVQVIDSSNNVANCTFTVRIIDDEDPIVNCPAEFITTTDAGLYTAYVSFTAPNATDNSGGMLNVQSNYEPGDLFMFGSTNVSYTFQDESNNTALCQFTVIVNDEEDPTITCPGKQVVDTTVDQAIALNVTYESPVSFDNSGDVEITCWPGNGSDFTLGLTLVTCTATDPSNNTAACDIAIEVVDNQPPTIECNITETYYTPANSATVTLVNTIIDYSDNVEIADVFQSYPPGYELAIGETVITNYVNDTSGNSASCSVTVIVIDNILPVITNCPSNFNMSTDVGSNSATISWQMPNATDNDGLPPSVSVNLVNGGSYEIGEYEVVYNFTDSSNNTAICTFTFSVYDDEAPTTDDCPSDIIDNNTPGADENVAVTWPALSWQDNSNAFIDVDQSHTPPDVFPIGTNVVVYTATDIYGNVGYCRFNVTILDNEDPVVSYCPGDITNTTEFYGNVNPQVYWDEPTATDNSGNVSVTSSNRPGDTFQIGDSGTVVTYTFTDVYDNAAMCQFTVTIADLIHPVIYNISGNLTYFTLPGVNYAIAMWEDPMAMDNSEMVILATTIPSGSQFEIGTTEVCVVALDPSDNGDRACFYVTVIDNEAPVFVSYPMEDIVQFTDVGVQTIVLWNLPIVTDNSGSFYITNDINAGDLFDIGEYTVYYNATDPYGNTAFISFRVIILETDNDAPNITCPESVEVESDATRPYATNVVWSDIYAEDLNGIFNITSSVQNGSTFNLGETNVTYWASDTSGNIAECTFTVTVIDMEDPVVTNCPENITDTTDSGSPNGIVSIPSPTISDNSGSYSVEQTPPGMSFGIGITWVTLTVSDEAGNTAECSFTVEIIDDEDPTVDFCPTNILVDNDPQLATAVLNWTEPIASDNDSPLTLTTSHTPNVDQFYVGDTLVNYTWTDPSENTATCLFTVTVRDVEDPVYSGCPNSQITAETPTGLNTTMVYWMAPTVTDNVGVVINISDYEPNDVFSIGITTVTYHAEDEAGNEANCIFTILVEDTENPVFPTCSQLQPSVTVETLPGRNYNNVTWSVPEAIDNDIVTDVTSNAEFGVFEFGSHAILYTAYDNSGNTGTCAFLVIVEDNEKPQLTMCPNDTDVMPDVGMDSALVYWDEPMVTDNVDKTPFILSTIDSNTTLLIGSHRVTYTAIDQSGNSETCTFTINVLDEEPPEFMNCPNNITQPTDAGEATAIVTWTPPTATDNAATPTVLSTFNPNDEFAYLYGGFTPVFYTAYDLSGNSALCIFYITIEDLEKPVFLSQPQNISVPAVDIGAYASVIFDIPDATDNVGVILTSPIPVPGTQFPLGDTPVDIIAFDAAGNQERVSFVVTVFDDTDPSYTNCPGQIFFNTDFRSSTATAVWQDLILFDNDRIQEEYNTDISPSLLPVGMNTIYNNATDPAGNSAECIFEVVVTDNEEPYYEVCPNSFTVIASSTSNETEVSWTVSTPRDNVEVVNETRTHSTNDLFVIGTYAIRYEATDPSGNIGTCEFTLAVQDATAPTFTTCPDGQTYDADTGKDGTNVFWTEPVAVDNSGNVMTVIMTPVLTSGDYLTIGQYNINFTAIDAMGNIGYCFFTIVIEDNELPNITYCPENIETLPDFGTNTANVTFEVPTAVDNSGSLNIQGFPLPGSVFMPGINTVIYTFTDPSNNYDDCTFTVTVQDDEAPTVTGCPSSIDASTAPGLPYQVVNWTEPTFMDNAGSPQVVKSHESGSQFSIGVTYVNYTASDSFGNERVCSFTITIFDDEFPEINNCPENQRLTITSESNTIAAIWTPPTATDNSGQPALSSNYPSGYQFQSGVTYVIYEARDSSGNKVQCTFSITVNDNQPPVFVNCPGNIDENTDFRQPTATVNWTEPYGVDNVDGNLTSSSTYAPGSTFPVGTYTNTYESTDNEGNTGTCVFTITVNDREIPQIFNCPVSFVVDDTNIARWAPPTATDNTVLVTLTSTVNPGSTLESGITNVMYTAYDQYENEAYCFFSVNIQGTGAPVITVCPASQVIVANEGDATTIAIWDEPMAIESGSSLVADCNYYSGAEFAVDSLNEVNCVFTASTDLESICSFTVTIDPPEDTEDPEISNCPADQTIEAEFGSETASATWTPPTATDNSNTSPTLSVTKEPGSDFDIGITDVVYIARDSSGNTGSCQFKITVTGFVDSGDPVIEDCPSNINEFVSSGTTSYQVSWDPPSATDDSGAVEITTDYEPGFSFPANENTLVTYTATDDKGNEDFCTFTVSITVDTEAPTVTNCPTDITETILSGEISTSVTWTSPTVQDNSGDYTVISSPTPGSDFNQGVRTVTYTISDNYGNINNDCSFTVTVTVDEPPTFSFCPDSSSIDTDLNSASGTAVWTTPVAEDDIDGAVIPTSTSSSGQPLGIGNNPIVYTATDSSNQETECSFSITVNDNQDPEFITTPDSPVAWALAGEPSASVTWVEPVVNDNADPSPVVTLTGGTNGGSYDVGTTTLTYIVTDESGNFATYSFNAIVNEDLPPQFTLCPASSSVNTDQGLSTATEAWTTPVATDARDGAITPTSSSSSGQEFEFGSNQVTYTAVDSSGQSTQCVFFITVLDNQDPQITQITPPVPVTAALGATTALVSWPEPTVSDNVDPTPSILLTGGTNGGAYDIGTTDLTYTVTDSSGNSITYDFEVVVNEFPEDTTEPVFTFCPGAVTVNNSPGLATGVASWTLPVATDDRGSVSVTPTFSSGTYDIGTTPVVYSATDGVNTVTCTVLVQVIDNEDPVISNCPANMNYYVLTLTTAALVIWVEPVASDNNAITSFSSNLQSGVRRMAGTETVTYTATDAASNTDECIFVINILVETDPISIMGSVVMDEIRGVDGTFSTTAGNLLIPQLEQDLDDLFRASSIGNVFAGITVSMYSFDDDDNVVVIYSVELASGSTLVASDIENAFENRLTSLMFATDNLVVAASFNADLISLSGSVIMDQIRGVDGTFSDASATTLIAQLEDDLNALLQSSSISPDFAGLTITSNAFDDDNNVLIEFNTYLVADSTLSTADIEAAFYAALTDGTNFDTNDVVVANTFIIGEDVCATSPCQNDGVCQRVGTTYTCTCADGYQGTNCESDIDECAANICRNDQVCTNLIGSYICECDIGFFEISSTCVAVRQITGGFTIISIGVDDATFTEAYNDPSSDEYRELVAIIIEALTAIFQAADGFLGIQILDFSSGSIVVDFVVLLEEAGATEDDLNTLFDQNVNSAGELSGSTLDLDPDNTQSFHEICPDDYCKNGGTCSMDMNDFESSCTCADGYSGETCDSEKLDTLVIVAIVVGAIGGLLLLLFVCCCFYLLITGSREDAMYRDDVVLNPPMYVNTPVYTKENMYDNRNLQTHFSGKVFTHHHMPHEKKGARFKHNSSRPYIVTGNELDDRARRDRVYYDNF